MAFGGQYTKPMVKKAKMPGSTTVYDPATGKSQSVPDASSRTPGSAGAMPTGGVGAAGVGHPASVPGAGTMATGSGNLGAAPVGPGQGGGSGSGVPYGVGNANQFNSADPSGMYSGAGGGGWTGGDIGFGNLAQDPTIMLRAMAQGQVGGAPSGGLSPTGQAIYSPLGNVANAFYMLMNPTGGSLPQFANYLQNFWQNASGGGNFNDQALWNSLNHPTGALQDYLGGGSTQVDPFTQMKNYKGLATAIASATMHPLFAQAYMNQLDNQFGNYGLAASRNDTSGNLPALTSFLMGGGG